MAATPPAGRLSVKRACLQPFLGGSPPWQRDLLSWAVDSGWPWRPGHNDDVSLSLAKAAEARLTRIRATTLLRRWASPAALAALEPAGDADVATESDRLTVTARGPDPNLLLPPLGATTAASIHVLVDILVPEPTEAQLFWSTPEVPYYNENQSVRVLVTGARQVIALTTPAIELAGQLRFDPGTSAGRYAIYGVEIWSGAVA